MVFRKYSMKRRRSTKGRRSLKRRSFKRRRSVKGFHKGNLKRRRTVYRRRGMPSGYVPTIRKYISPVTAPNALKGHYYLRAYWNNGILVGGTGAGQFSVTAATPAMFCTAINWNTLNQTAHNALLSDKFGAVNALSNPPRGVAKIALRFNATRVIAYRITISNLRDETGANAEDTFQFALTPVMYEAYNANFSGTAPNKVWPGADVNDQWEACRMHPRTKTTVVGNSYTDGARGSAARISHSVHLNQMATDPAYQAFITYSEYGGTAIAAAFREPMVLTAVCMAPTGTRVHNINFDVHEEWWVTAFEPIMPAIITMAEEVGEKAAKDFMDKRREEAKVRQAHEASDALCDELVMDEKDFETQISGLNIQERPMTPVPLVRTESKVVRSPAPLRPQLFPVSRSR